MKEQVNVKYVQRYDFVDNKTGGRIAGVKICYESDKVVKNENAEGIQQINLTTPDLSMFEKFRGHVPGRFELDMQIVPAGSKTRIELLDATYIEPIKMAKVS